MRRKISIFPHKRFPSWQEPEVLIRLEFPAISRTTYVVRLCVAQAKNVVADSFISLFQFWISFFSTCLLSAMMPWIMKKLTKLGKYENHHVTWSRPGKRRVWSLELFDLTKHYRISCSLASFRFHTLLLFCYFFFREREREQILCQVIERELMKWNKIKCPLAAEGRGRVVVGDCK